MSATNNTEGDKFQGFRFPRQNWFKLPNEWIDICADISSIAEIKVVQYVMRHTWGHQEYGIRKRITLDEFMNGRCRKDGSRLDKGTGLSKPSVIKGLRNAVKRGLLLEEVDSSDKARVKKYYSLCMMHNEDVEEEGEESLTPQENDRGVKNLNADVKNFYPEVKSFNPRGQRTLHRTEKDTTEKHLEKESNNNSNGSNSEPENAVVVALTSHGIAKGVAEKLARQHTASYIEEKIEYHDFLKAERPQDIQKPAAWLRKAIEDDYSPPDGFVAAKDREQHLKEEKERLQAVTEAQRHESKRAEERQVAQREYLVQQYGVTDEEIALWQRTLSDVQMALQPEVYKAYLEGSLLLSIKEGTARISLKDPKGVDWTKRQLSRLIQKSLSEYAGEPIEHLEIEHVPELYEILTG